MCTVCNEGFAQQSDGSCENCSTSYSTSVLLGLLGILLTLVALFAAWRSTRAFLKYAVPNEDERSKKVELVQRKIKIVYTMIQILSGFPLLLGLTYICRRSQERRGSNIAWSLLLRVLSPSASPS